MKKVLFMVFLFASFAFARMSTKHQIVSPPSNATLMGVESGFICAKDYVDDGNSTQWKRRHKRRKKSRGRQRGR